ncbi:MAG: hypothetical protein LQ344_000247 [Seirophora lacunosa]|nr:MAG: hypothetical protein LQ344_000247 [Seirophora lacunosa]
MGWFSGWFGDNNPPEKGNNDPLRNLDPSLRDFLDKESPSKYETSSPPPQPQPQQPSTQVKPTSPPTGEKEQEGKEDPSTTRPAVPPESLFQDGRYAHLWTTYKPRAEVENALKSDQEKLMDMLDGYQYRKARIGKAAMENCSEEQEAMHHCYRHGNFKQTMTVCRKENRAFERCYTMQARFLKALGYLAADDEDRPAEVEERIQMHADKLYHQMLAQEAAASEAAAQGLPAPTFEPVIAPFAASAPVDHNNNNSPPTTSTGAPLSASAAATIESARHPLSYEESKRLYLQKLKPHVREALEKQWTTQQMSEEQKMLAARACAMEAEAGIGVANQVGGMLQEIQRKREERRSEGKGTLGDIVSGWLGR